MPGCGNPSQSPSHSPDESNGGAELGVVVSRLIDVVRTTLNADQCMMVLSNRATYTVYTNRNGKGSGIQETEVLDPGHDVITVLKTNRPRVVESDSAIIALPQGVHSSAIC